MKSIIEESGVDTIDTEDDGTVREQSAYLHAFIWILQLLFYWYIMNNSSAAYAGENICKRLA